MRLRCGADFRLFVAHVAQLGQGWPWEDRNRVRLSLPFLPEFDVFEQLLAIPGRHLRIGMTVPEVNENVPAFTPQEDRLPKAAECVIAHIAPSHFFQDTGQGIPIDILRIEHGAVL